MEMSINMDKLNAEKAALVDEKVKIQEKLANLDNLQGKLEALKKDFEEKKAELAKKQESIQDINNKISSDKEISLKFKSFDGQKKSLLSELEDVRFALLTVEVISISIALLKNDLIVLNIRFQRKNVFKLGQKIWSYIIIDLRGKSLRIVGYHFSSWLPATLNLTSKSNEH